MNTLIPCYIKLLNHDLGLRPLKIISLISNKAKRLGGVNMGYSQEKPPRLTRNKKKFSLNIWPDQSLNPQWWADWFRNSSLNLLSPEQTELQNWLIFIENCLCFIQLVLLYEQKSCTRSYNLKVCVNGPLSSIWSLYRENNEIYN